MGSKRIRKNGTVELCIKHRLLPRPAYFTFDTLELADAYESQLQRLLAAGHVPPELLQPDSPVQPLLAHVIRDYLNHASPKASAADVLDLVREDANVATLPMDRLTFRWVEGWVKGFKLDQGLAPGTIRKRVGTLAQCVDWHLRRTESQVANPLRLLPRGYSTYNEAERKVIGVTEDAAPRDRVRDRRLEPGEEARIRGVMAGEKREDRERALEMPEREALQLLFTLALETAMRMSEMYTLTVDQVMLSKRSIALERTKNGDSRQVPLSSVAMDALREWLERGARPIPGQVFPWFNPEAPVRDQERRRVTTRLSQQFQRIFAYAGITDLTFHDLRHEATCRLYERTKFSDIQIARVTGHKDPRMLLRYASLRGSDLAAGMW